MNNNTVIFKDINEDKYEHFCIGKDNYSVLFKKKALDNYLQFHEKIYLQ